jgi:hypothetical protein
MLKLVRQLGLCHQRKLFFITKGVIMKVKSVNAISVKNHKSVLVVKSNIKSGPPITTVPF